MIKQYLTYEQESKQVLDNNQSVIQITNLIKNSSLSSSKQVKLMKSWNTLSLKLFSPLQKTRKKNDVNPISKTTGMLLADELRVESTDVAQEVESFMNIIAELETDSADGVLQTQILHSLYMAINSATGTNKIKTEIKNSYTKGLHEVVHDSDISTKKREEIGNILILLETTKTNLDKLKLDIQEDKKKNLNKEKQKLDEYNVEQRTESLIKTENDNSPAYHALVKTLMYGSEDKEINSNDIVFADAINSIIESDENDIDAHSKNFEIMLDPENDKILSTFLVNLANLPSKSLESNLLVKLRGCTTPMISGKLESYNPQPASYSTRETKIIQLEVALYLSEYKESHPEEDKQIPLPYKKSKNDKLGYPDIFAIPKKNDPNGKEIAKVLDITWYIYAMESQKIFEEKDDSGNVMNVGQIFDYLSVLPEWDLQRKVVIEFAHKYRTINKLKYLDKDKDNLKHPVIPEHSNYRSYLFQLINNLYLEPKGEQSLDKPQMQEGPDTDEQMIKKYMLYLIQLSEQQAFKEKVTTLNSQISKLSKLITNDQKEYNKQINLVAKAYSELTELLKANNNTWSWLYNMMGSPVIMGTLISPSHLPFDSDDPREKELFVNYSTLYTQMNNLEKDMLDLQHKVAKKQAELFGLTTKNNSKYFSTTYDNEYRLSFEGSRGVSPIPSKLVELQNTINSSNFEIKNSDSDVYPRNIRTVDVYNQLRSTEGFNYAKHVSIPNPVSDEAEILTTFGGNNDQGRNNITNYLKKKGVNPSFAYTTHYQPRTPKSVGEYKVQTETKDSPSYKKKQLQALCQVLHKVTIPGMGNYITENIPAEAFEYLQNREKIFTCKKSTFTESQSNRIINNIHKGFIDDNNDQTQARFILLPSKNEGEPYSLFQDGMDLWKNLYFAKIDKDDNIGIIGMPPHTLASPATPNDPFIYKKRNDEGSIKGYGKAIQAQQERQLIFDNDPLLQQSESLLLEIKGIAAPLLHGIELYNVGKNGDKEFTNYLEQQIASLKTTLNSGKPRTKREEMQDAVTHVRMYIAKYDNTKGGSDIIGNYEATILKYKSISRELESFSTMKLSALDSRDAAGLYTLLKTLVVIAGTISVTVASGGALGFAGRAVTSVLSGMAMGRIVDEGRYVYLNQISPISYPVQTEEGGIDTKLLYDKRSDIMEAVEGKKEWSDVVLGMGQEFSVGMFRYMIGTGLVKVGSNGLTKFQKSIKHKMSETDFKVNNPALYQTFTTIDDIITKRLSSNVDVLQSQGMKNFFKHFFKEYPQEMTEEGLGDIGQKLGGDYGGPVGAVIEAIINIKSKNKHFSAGGVKVRPTIKKTPSGSQTEFLYSNGTDVSGIKAALERPDMGWTVVVNSGTGEITATKQDQYTTTISHTMVFKATDEHPAILDIQTDPELAKYSITKKETEDGENVVIYDAIVYDNKTQGPSKEDRIQLLRYHNCIIVEEGDDHIMIHDSNGKVMKIEFVRDSDDVVKEFNFETASDQELVNYFENRTPQILHYVGEQPTLSQKADFIRLSGGSFLLSIPGRLTISKKTDKDSINNNEFEIQLELVANTDPKNDATSEYTLQIGTEKLGTPEAKNYIYIKSINIPHLLYGNKPVDGYELVNETLLQGIKLKDRYPDCFVNGQGTKHGKNGRYSFARYGFAAMYPSILEAEINSSNLSEKIKGDVIAECKIEGGHPLDILMRTREGRERRGGNPNTANFVFDFSNPKHIDAAKKYKEMRDNLKKSQGIAVLDQISWLDDLDPDSRIIDRKNFEIISNLSRMNKEIFEEMRNKGLNLQSILSYSTKSKNLEKLCNLYGSSREDFQSIWGEAANRYILRNVRSENLELVWQWYGTSTKTFERLCKGQTTIRTFLSAANPRNLELVWKRYGTSREEFESLCDSDAVYYILSNGNHENLKKVLEWCADKADFEKMCSDLNIRSVLTYSNTELLDSIRKWYGTNKETFEKMCADTKIQSFIIMENYQNIKMVRQWYGTSKETFEKMCKNHRVFYMLRDTDPKNLELVRQWYGTDEETFEQMCDSKSIPSVMSSMYPENFEKVKHWYGTSREAFESMCENDNIVAVLGSITPVKLELIWGLYGTSREVFENLCDSNNIANLITDANEDNLKQIIDWSGINKETFETICNNKDIHSMIKEPREVFQLLFSFVSHDYSYTGLTDLQQRMIKNKLFAVPEKSINRSDRMDSLLKNTKKGLYDIMSGDIEEHLIQSKLPVYDSELRKESNEKLCKIFSNSYSEAELNAIQSLQIPDDKIELSVYIRYGHQVDYPAIAEYITLFLSKYIEAGHSKYISGVRVIPRQVGEFPRTGLFTEGKNIKPYDVSGNSFERALTGFAVPVHLSHSNFKDNGLPHIISSSMYSDSANAIKLPLELEQDYDSLNTPGSSLESIFKICTDAMQELDRRFDIKLQDGGVSHNSESNRVYTKNSFLDQLKNFELDADNRSMLEEFIDLADYQSAYVVIEALGTMLFVNGEFDHDTCEQILSILSLDDENLDLHEYLMQKSSELGYEKFYGFVVSLTKQHLFEKFAVYRDDDISSPQLSVRQLIQIIDNHIIDSDGTIRKSVSQKLESIRSERYGADDKQLLNEKMRDLREQLVNDRERIAKLIPIMEAYIYTQSSNGTSTLTVGGLYDHFADELKGMDIETIGSILTVAYDTVYACKQAHDFATSEESNLTILTKVLGMENMEAETKGIGNEDFEIFSYNDSVVFRFRDRDAFLSLYYKKGEVVREGEKFIKTDTGEEVIPPLGINIQNTKNGLSCGCIIIRPGLKNNFNTYAETLHHEGIHTGNTRLIKRSDFRSNKASGGSDEVFVFLYEQSYKRLQDEIIAQVGGERKILKNPLVNELKKSRSYDYIGQLFGKNYNEKKDGGESITYESLKKQFDKDIEKYVDIALLMKKSEIPHRMQLLRLYPIHQWGKLVQIYNLHNVRYEFTLSGSGRSAERASGGLMYNDELMLINGLLLDGQRIETFESNSPFIQKFVVRFDEGSMELQYLLCREGSGVSTSDFNELMNMKIFDVLTMDPSLRDSKRPGINTIIKNNIEHSFSFWNSEQKQINGKFLCTDIGKLKLGANYDFELMKDIQKFGYLNEDGTMQVIPTNVISKEHIQSLFTLSANERDSMNSWTFTRLLKFGITSREEKGVALESLGPTVAISDLDTKTLKEGEILFISKSSPSDGSVQVCTYIGNNKFLSKWGENGPFGILGKDEIRSFGDIIQFSSREPEVSDFYNVIGALNLGVEDMRSIALVSPRATLLATNSDYNKIIQFINPIDTVDPKENEKNNLRRKMVARELLGREVGDEIVSAHEAPSLREKVQILKNANPSYTSDEIRILMKWYVCGRVTDLESKPLLEDISGVKEVFGKHIKFKHRIAFDDEQFDDDEYKKNPLNYETALSLCGFNSSNTELLDMIDFVEIYNDDFHDNESISIDLKFKGGGSLIIVYNTSDPSTLKLGFVEKANTGMNFPQLFDQIISYAKEVKISKIILYAADSKLTALYNGYYIWPSYGFTEVDSSRASIIKQIKKEILSLTALDIDPRVKTQLQFIVNRYNNGYYNTGTEHSIMKDIYQISTPKASSDLNVIDTGFKFWRKYGCAFHGEFHIGKMGSQTQHEKDFQNYKTKKQTRDNLTQKKENKEDNQSYNGNPSIEQGFVRRNVKNREKQAEIEVAVDAVASVLKGIALEDAEIPERKAFAERLMGDSELYQCFLSGLVEYHLNVDVKYDETTIIDAFYDVYIYSKKSDGMQSNIAKKIIDAAKDKTSFKVKKVLEFHHDLAVSEAKTLQKKLMNSSEEDPIVEIQGKEFDLYRLTTAHHLEQETAQLGHCVGMKGHIDVHLNKIQSGKMIVYSVRDKKGKSIATIELSKDTQGGGYTINQASGQGQNNTIFEEGKKGYEEVVNSLVSLSNNYKITSVKFYLKGFIEQGGNCQYLTILDLYGRQGSTPPDLSKFPNLTTLNLGGRKGSTPPDLSNCPNLTTLDLGGRQGSTSPNLSNCPNLTTLNLGGRKGSTPPDLSNCPNLTTLDISRRKGSTSPNLSKCPNLTTLNLAARQGSTSPNLSKCPNLTTLDISRRQGSTPPDLSNFPNLTTLNLAARQGSTSPDLSKCPNLTTLNLAARQGSTPPDLSKCPNLTTLNLAARQGSTPPDLSNCQNLTTLNLYGRQGSTPPDLSNCPNLTTLDLSRRQGSTSPDLSNFPNLTTLNLSGRQGSTPPDLSNCQNLATLNLYGRKGSTPPDLSNCPNLTTLDLSRRQGSTPPDLSALQDRIDAGLLEIKY